jgi:hypothetical protein
MRPVMSSSISGGDRGGVGDGGGGGIMPQGMGGVGPWGVDSGRGGMGDEAEGEIKVKKKRRRKKDNDEGKDVFTMESYDGMPFEPKVRASHPTFRALNPQPW